MPVRVEKRDPKFRVVESVGHKIAKNSKKSAVDGGGHSTKDAAIKQSQAININLRKKKRKKK